MPAWLVLLLAVALAADQPDMPGDLVSAVQMRDIPLINTLLDSREYVPSIESAARALIQGLDIPDTPTRIRLIEQLGPQVPAPELIYPLRFALLRSSADRYPIKDRLRRRPRPYARETELLTEVLRRALDDDDTLLSIAVRYNNLPIVKHALSLPSAAEEMATVYTLGNNLAHYAVFNAYARESDGPRRSNLIAHAILEVLQAAPGFQTLMTLDNDAGITPEDIPHMERRDALAVTNPTANQPSGNERILTPVAQRQHAEVPQPYTTFTGNEPECPICLEDIDATSPVVELVHPWTPGTYAPRRPGPQEKPHLFHTACLREHTRLNGNSDGVTFDPEARTYFYKWTRQYGDAV